MDNVQVALDEVRALYRELVGAPPPEISPSTYIAFPPGVDPIHHAVEEVEQLKRLSRRVASAPAPASWAPRADTFTAPDGLLIQLEIPGVARQTLKVFLAGGECVVRGERKLVPSEGLRPLAVERPWGKFERRFMLPPGIHPDKVTALHRDGVLEIRIAGDGAGLTPETSVEVQ